MIPAFVINLQERKDRWNHIQNKLKDFPLQIHRIEAIRGNDSLTATPFVRGCLKQKVCNRYHIESYGALGCAASHIEAWKRVNSVSVIFEDDADPVETALSKLHEAISFIENNTYDLVFLGSHKPPSLKNRTLIPWLYSGVVSTGAWAYILSPNAAKVLLENAYPLDLSIDLYIQTVNLRIGYVPCFKQRFFLQSPDIQHLQEKIYSKNELMQFIWKICVFTVVVTLAVAYLVQRFLSVS